MGDKDFMKIAGNVHLAYYVEAAERLGIDHEIVVRSLMAKFKYQGKHWFIINTALPVNSVTGSTIAKRKNLTYKVLNAADIPVASQIEAENFDTVRDFFDKYEHIVVKPVQNLGGTGVSILPRDHQELRIAYDNAVNNNKSKTKVQVLAEQFVKGSDYRLLVCGDKVIGAVYRKPACVIGNGKDTIEQLITSTNSERRSRLLKPIVVDSEVTKCLSTKGLSLDFTPQEGQEVLLRFNSNLSTGGTTEECLSSIDPYYLDLAVRATKAIGLEVAGVDLIAEDVTKKAFCVINEINYNPGLRVHYKVDKGAISPVAVPIMEYIRDHFVVG